MTIIGIRPLACLIFDMTMRFVMDQTIPCKGKGRQNFDRHVGTRGLAQQVRSDFTQCYMIRVASHLPSHRSRTNS